MSKSKLCLSFASILLMIGCETENPGEPKANILPDTYISKAIAGNITIIYFYGTDKDGFVNDYAYKWDTDNEWSNTTYDSATFVDVFADQNEVKRFYVKGIDNNGAEDPTPAEIALSADNVLPETKIISGPEFGSETGEDVTFTFAGTDMDSGGLVVSFQYTIDDLDNWRETTVNFPQATYLGLAVGAHTFYVRAVDNLGGSDTTPAQSAFIVRSGKFTPTLINTSPVRDGGGWPANIVLLLSWKAETASYYGNLASDPYSYAMDDSTHFNSSPVEPLASGWNSNTSLLYLPIMGMHTFYLKARDTAGGVSKMSINFTVATYGPQGVLVVCGVQAAQYGSQFVEKINSGAYWGSLYVNFWDIYGTPDNPQSEFSLPANVYYYGGGTVEIPLWVLADNTTIVWLGDNQNVGINIWQQLYINYYLLLGGNVVLASRSGQEYLSEELIDYLQIQFGTNVSSPFPTSTILEYKTIYPGLVDMTPFSTIMDFTSEFSASDFLNAADDNTVTNWDSVSYYSNSSLTSTLLFAHRSNNYNPNFPFSVVSGLGVWSHPNFPFSSISNPNEFPTPGTDQAKGNFIFISGRHYGFDTQACRQNFEFILRNMCGEQ